LAKAENKKGCGNDREAILEWSNIYGVVLKNGTNAVMNHKAAFHLKG